MERKCSKCEREKLLEEFPSKGRLCKKCRQDLCKEWRQNNVEKIRAYNQHYSKSEEHKKRKRQLHSQNSDRINARVRNRRKADIDNARKKGIQAAKKYRDNNPDKIKARADAYYLNNTEKLMQYQREYIYNLGNSYVNQLIVKSMHIDIDLIKSHPELTQNYGAILLVKRAIKSLTSNPQNHERQPESSTDF